LQRCSDGRLAGHVSPGRPPGGGLKLLYMPLFDREEKSRPVDPEAGCGEVSGALYPCVSKVWLCRFGQPDSFDREMESAGRLRTGIVPYCQGESCAVWVKYSGRNRISPQSRRGGSIPSDPRVVEAIGPLLFVASDPHRSVRLVQDRHLAAIGLGFQSQRRTRVRCDTKSLTSHGISLY